MEESSTVLMAMTYSEESDDFRKTLKMCEKKVLMPGALPLEKNDTHGFRSTEYGPVFFGISEAAEQETLADAVENLILLKKNLRQTKYMIFHVSGDERILMMQRFADAYAILEDYVLPNTPILIGASSDRSLGRAFHVTIMAVLYDFPRRGSSIMGCKKILKRARQLAWAHW